MELKNQVIGWAKCVSEVGGFKVGTAYAVMGLHDADQLKIRDEDGDELPVRKKYFQIVKRSEYLAEKIETAFEDFFPTLEGDEDYQLQIAQKLKWKAVFKMYGEQVKEEIWEELTGRLLRRPE